MCCVDEAMSRYSDDGDQASFAQVYAHVAPRLRAFVSRRRGETIADELVQETCFRMIRARGTYRRGACVMIWAYAICRRLLIDQHHVEQWTSDDPELVERVMARLCSVVTPEDEVRMTQARQRVVEAYNRLSADAQDTLRLVLVDGLSHAQTAQLLGCTVNAIALRICHSMEPLCLAGRGDA